MPFINEINKLRNRLEDIKEKVSNEEIICYFAKDHVEKLFEEEKRLKVILQELNVERKIIKKIDCLINETKQFVDDIIDIIEVERNKCL